MRMNPFFQTLGRLCSALVLLAVCHIAAGQDRYHLRMQSMGTWWDFPYAVADISHFGFSADGRTLEAHTPDDVVIPFAVDRMDSITLEDEPAVETKNRFRVFPMYITTDNGLDITSRDDYTPCRISLNALGSYSNYSGKAEIRGRGNSTWLWYDKKPYRIKLNAKHKLLGMGKGKSWVLLANYRDVTDLMNTFVFEAGRALKMPYTNDTRYVELFVNGDYRGVYQLTQQVQQGSNRVEIDDDRGILLSLDVDDGPGESTAADNFYTEVFRMPACVKYPKDEALTSQRLDSVRRVFAVLEAAIDRQDFRAVDSLLDMQSFIHYLQLQELVENVELVAPRSIYMHKDGDGKWVMGPLWDFDAGFDFDWTTMLTGHNYFGSSRKLVLGTDPLHRNGYDRNIPKFFTQLFGCPEFVKMYKEEWNRIKDTLVPDTWAVMTQYLDNMKQGPAVRESRRWPIAGKDFDTEVRTMHYWLLDRVDYLTEVINAYPEP